ncbi:MAG: gamma-glutamyl-gamma-aminobutyrate hydrolase family protein [Cyanobacteria bacterium P01_E01_bin.6]
MTPPLIGITTYGLNANQQYHLYANYLVAVRQAGGVPVLLAPGEEQIDVLCDRLDGLLFTGGGDINPTLYGGESHATIYSLDEERDSFDLALAKKALGLSLPILGICRGMQTLHLASGGKPLITHVPDSVDGSILHRQEPPSVSMRARPVEHGVQVSPGSRLAAIVGAEAIPVVSWHHQAIPAVSDDWALCGQAADGLIEAMEHQQHLWALAVQWHPEMSIDDGYQLKILKAFVDAAQLDK